VPAGAIISENPDSLLTAKDTGNSTDFRPLNRKNLPKRPLARAFLDFPQRKLTGRKVQVTGRGFQKSGNEQGKRPFLTRLFPRGSEAICSRRRILKVKTQYARLVSFNEGAPPCVVL
jgi:hypothetical protein